MTNHPQKGRGQGNMTYFISMPAIMSPELLKRESPNFVWR